MAAFRAVRDGISLRVPELLQQPDKGRQPWNIVCRRRSTGGDNEAWIHCRASSIATLDAQSILVWLSPRFDSSKLIS
jgi:hypothetical protein